MMQIKDKGPDISVVDDQRHVKAPLKVVEEEFEKRKAGEAVMTSSVSRSIMDTVSGQLYWSFLHIHTCLTVCLLLQCTCEYPCLSGETSFALYKL